LEQVLADTVLFSSVRLVEERLAEHFQVSRTVIRDVLTRLHVVGLVQKDASGRWIAERITLEHISELYELRCLLEPTALKQAMADPDSRFVEMMERHVLDVIEGRVPRTAERLHQLEQHLHVDMLSRCSNRALWRALQRTQLILVSNRSMFAINIAASAKAVTGSVVEHLEIIRLIRSGDADKAAAALANHLRVSQSIWLDRFSEITSAATLTHPHYLLDL
jgi:DNA-binding GntR family transcriptional regulator